MKHPMVVCLWFDGQAKAAADYYCSVFKDARILDENPMVVNFELNGMRFMALNGGGHFQFNEAVSIVVPCESQAEIDYFWNRFVSDGGKESMCGWLKDKFGFSWQIVPDRIGEWMQDPAKAQRMMPLIMEMRKIDMNLLEQA